MSPDQVTEWCKLYDDPSFFNPDNIAGASSFGQQIEKLQDLEKATPVQYAQNIEVLIADYRLVADQTRLYPQIRDEVKSNFKPLNQLQTQICH